MLLVWSSDLELGIPVIDSQHQRIVDYINQVIQAQQYKNKQQILEVLNELVEYTLSHFTFEESMMEEAGYPFVNAHKKVHQLFARRVSGFQQRVMAGEDVTEELLHVLKAWLVNHIKRDDKDYTGVVHTNLEATARRAKARKGGWLRKLFR